MFSIMTYRTTGNYNHRTHLIAFLKVTKNELCASCGKLLSQTVHLSPCRLHLLVYSKIASLTYKVHV